MCLPRLDISRRYRPRESVGMPVGDVYPKCAPTPMYFSGPDNGPHQQFGPPKRGASLAMCRTNKISYASTKNPSTIGISQQNFTSSALSLTGKGEEGIYLYILPMPSMNGSTSVGYSYVPNPNTLRYAHTGNNTRCYTTEGMNIRS